MANSFFIWLDSSKCSSRNNKSKSTVAPLSPALFRTTLARPIFLTDDWEVALIEILFTNNFQVPLIAPARFDIHPYFPIDTPVRIIHLQEPLSVEFFSAPQYADCDSLARAINEQVQSTWLARNPREKPEEYFHLEKDRTEQLYKICTSLERMNRVWLSLENEAAFELFTTLGFVLQTFNAESRSLVGLPQRAAYPSFLPKNKTPKTIFVHCDCIEKQYVATRQAEVLRVLPAPTFIADQQQQQTTFESFDQPIYVKIKVGYISEIEIALRDQNGDLLKFTPLPAPLDDHHIGRLGSVNLTLHFRKRTI